jgi:sulfate permease, SulP family
LAAGFICGVLVVVLSIGNATLLARGDLASSVAMIAGIILFAAAVLAISTAYFSTIPGQVTGTQEISVVAMGSVVGAVSAAFSGARTDSAYLATIVVTMGLTTLLCGLVMFWLGRARFGRIIRFVPYPVFGGFLAITGWYLLVGGMETVVGHHLSLQNLGSLFESGTGIKVALAVAFVVLVQLFNARVSSGAVLPIAIIATIAVFDIVVLFLGVSQTQLEQLGWVITVPAQEAIWPPFGLSDLARLDWTAIGAGLLYAPFVVLVTSAAAMMNVSGIELELKGDVDLNRELRSMGIGNILSGLGGGIPGFPGVSATLLAVRMGAAERTVGVVTGIILILALIYSSQLLAIAPAPLFGALLMWIGVSLLIDWVIKPLRTLRRSEHGIILLILAVSIAAGFPSGIITGLLAALVLFVFEYGRVEGVRFVASGHDYRSRMLSDERRIALEPHGNAIMVMKLSGFIFFGTSDRIIQKIKDRVFASAEGPLRFVVMDFRRVSGIDSSTILSFDRLKRLAQKDGFTVILTRLHEQTAARLRSSGLNIGAAPFHQEPDIDAGVSWAENGILKVSAPETLVAPLDPEVAAAKFFGDAALAKALIKYFEKKEFEPGSHLISQGSAADDIYFIESGEGVVVLEAEQGSPVRLMAFGTGTILGEVAFYRGERRSASAVANTPVKAWQLKRSALAEIELKSPKLAAAFHLQIARALAERLQNANRLIRVLAD